MCVLHSVEWPSRLCSTHMHHGQICLFSTKVLYFSNRTTHSLCNITSRVLKISVYNDQIHSLGPLRTSTVIDRRPRWKKPKVTDCLRPSKAWSRSTVRSRTLPTVMWVHACEWVVSLEGTARNMCGLFLLLCTIRGKGEGVCGYTVNEKANSLDSTSQLLHTTSVTHSLSFSPYPLYVLMAWRGFYLDRDWLMAEWPRLDSWQKHAALYSSQNSDRFCGLQRLLFPKHWIHYPRRHA